MRRLWESMNDYDSGPLQVVVVVTSFVCGVIFSLIVTVAWESMLDPSRFVTTVSRYVAFFSMYLLLSYIINVE